MVIITAEECVSDSDTDTEDLVHIPSPESSPTASIRIERELLEASNCGSNTSGGDAAGTRSIAALEEAGRAAAGEPGTTVLVDRAAARFAEAIFRPLPVKAAALTNSVLVQLKKASKEQISTNV